MSRAITLQSLQRLRAAFAKYAVHLDQCGPLRCVCPKKHHREQSCMCGLDDAMAEMDAMIGDMRAEAYPRSITPLSHLHPSWVAEVLGISHQAVTGRIDRGTLPTEVHHGSRLVPAWAVAQALERKNGKPEEEA